MYVTDKDHREEWLREILDLIAKDSITLRALAPWWGKSADVAWPLSVHRLAVDLRNRVHELSAAPGPYKSNCWITMSGHMVLVGASRMKATGEGQYELVKGRDIIIRLPGARQRPLPVDTIEITLMEPSHATS